METARMEESTGTIEERVRLRTGVILARGSFSPLEIARRKQSGRLELEANEGGRAFLEVGGVVVAEGLIVRRRGRAWLKLRKAFAGQGGEERK